MIYETVRLCDFYPTLPKTNTDVVLKSYAVGRDCSPRAQCRAAVLVLHGGGYFMKSVTEYEPVALKFMAEGYQAFTLDYSLLPSRYPQQLLEAAAAVDYIRSNAEKYNIDANKIIVCGFSAGAHLAALLASGKKADGVFDVLDLKCGAEPNGVILAYPPTDSDIPDCREMFENLMGSDDDRILHEISPLHIANEGMPSVFMWQTFDDEMVSVRHSLEYALRLRELGVFVELHIFPHGPHAMALCTEETAFTPAHFQPHAAQWFELAVKWMKYTFEK